MNQLGTRWRWLACAALVVGMSAGVATGCEPLYGNKPEKLVNPPKKKPPPAPPESSIEIKYVDDCAASFQDDPKKWHPVPSMAATLVNVGDTALDSSDKATDVQAKVGFIKDAIDKYRQALLKDPYNAAATLKLAVAYDRVLRKGCALALLKRLATLSNNPKVAPDAGRVIGSVSDNAQWFKGYRKDAMSAIGQ